LVKILSIWTIGMDVEKPKLFKKASFQEVGLSNI
jgi:hypothetical protein